MDKSILPLLLLFYSCVLCSSMSKNELDEFSDYLHKTSVLDQNLKVGFDSDQDSDEDADEASEHAWERSGKFEGDLILNDRQRRTIVENVAEGLSRNGLKDSTKRWPDNEVVYYIQKEHFSSDQVQAIKDGIDDLAQASCIKFRPYKKGDRDAVVIQGSRRGCFSQVGYQGGYQVLNLSARHPVGRGCFRHGTVVHEMLHTLGFYHMQSSPDRDDFIDVVWDNIVEPAKHNFRKYNTFSVSDFGVGYDYDSVLHYSRKAFSVNGGDTLVPKTGGAQIGQRVGLSDKDTKKLNKMYCDADSNNFDHDEESPKPIITMKKPKNQPFQGHGIGYHQGNALVIKLPPAAKAVNIKDVPKHVFNRFSKAPQALPPTLAKGFRAGKKITFEPPVEIVDNSSNLNHEPEMDDSPENESSHENEPESTTSKPTYDYEEPSVENHSFDHERFDQIKKLHESTRYSTPKYDYDSQTKIPLLSGHDYPLLDLHNNFNSEHISDDHRQYVPNINSSAGYSAKEYDPSFGTSLPFNKIKHKPYQIPDYMKLGDKYVPTHDSPYVPYKSTHSESPSGYEASPVTGYNYEPSSKDSGAHEHFSGKVSDLHSPYYKPKNDYESYKKYGVHSPEIPGKSGGSESYDYSGSGPQNSPKNWYKPHASNDRDNNESDDSNQYKESNQSSGEKASSNEPASKENDVSLYSREYNQQKSSEDKSVFNSRPSQQHQYPSYESNYSGSDGKPKPDYNAYIGSNDADTTKERSASVEDNRSSIDESSDRKKPEQNNQYNTNESNTSGEEITSEDDRDSRSKESLEYHDDNNKKEEYKEIEVNERPTEKSIYDFKSYEELKNIKPVNLYSRPNEIKPTGFDSSYDKYKNFPKLVDTDKNYYIIQGHELKSEPLKVVPIEKQSLFNSHAIETRKQNEMRDYKSEFVLLPKYVLTTPSLLEELKQDIVPREKDRLAQSARENNSKTTVETFAYSKEIIEDDDVAGRTVKPVMYELRSYSS